MALSQTERNVIAEALRRTADTLVMVAAAEIPLGAPATLIAPRVVEEISLAIGRSLGVLGNDTESAKNTRQKRPRKANPKLAKALKAANARFRKKNGDLRSGATQAKIMSYAHKLRRGM